MVGRERGDESVLARAVCQTDGALSRTRHRAPRHVSREANRTDTRVRADVKSAQASLVLLDSAQAQLQGSLAAIDHLLR